VELGIALIELKIKKSSLELLCLMGLHSLMLQHLLFKYDYLCGGVCVAA